MTNSQQNDIEFPSSKLFDQINQILDANSNKSSEKDKIENNYDDKDNFKFLSQNLKDNKETELNIKQDDAQISESNYQYLCENLKDNTQGFKFLNQDIKNAKNSTWTQFEDQKLKAITEKYGENKDWNEISNYFDNKNSVQCFHRWSKVVKPALSFKHWTSEEDSLLVDLVNQYGPSKWTEISRKLKKKTRTECINRWNFVISGTKYLRTLWLPSEELKLVLIVKKFGTYWSKIAKLFEDKDEYSTKNKFYSIMRRTANLKINKANENKSGDEKKNVFAFKLKDLIIYISDAIELLKNEQNVSDSYEDEVNKILDKEVSFSTLSEKLDKINVNQINKENSNGNLNEINGNINNDYNNLPRDINNINNVNNNTNINIFSNNLSNHFTNMLNQTSENKINYQNLTNLVPFKLSNQGNVPNAQNTTDDNACKMKNLCMQLNSNNKISLCKNCKTAFKEILKKKIIYNLSQKNLINNFNYNHNFNYIGDVNNTNFNQYNNKILEI